MARHTSIETYRTIYQALVPGLRKRIYEALLQASSPMTTSEIAVALGAKQRDSISPRMREMVQRRLIEEVGERTCAVTGRNKIVFYITGCFECKPVKKQSAASKLKQVHVLVSQATHYTNDPGEVHKRLMEIYEITKSDKE